jgi:hypothetical protein
MLTVAWACQRLVLLMGSECEKGGAVEKSGERLDGP